MTFKVKDHFFKKAKKENFLARSIYKLEEIDQKFKIFKPDNLVLDLGYHPGSWTQYASLKVGDKGYVVGIDIRPVDGRLDYLRNVKVFEKDINDISDVSDLGVTKLFDVVISDMAPNTTGIKSVDQDRSLQLIEMIFFNLPKFLKVGGDLVFKIFDSNQAQQFIKEKRNAFDQVKNLKPKSTRSISKEFFVICKGFKG